MRSPRLRRPGAALLAGLSLALVGSLILGAGIGAFPVPAAQVVRGALATLGLPVEADPTFLPILQAIRFPRVLLGAVVGAALALAGTLLQGVLRNPLADPGLLGVSSGAALAAAATIVLGPAAAAQPLPLSLAAFGGALAAIALVVGLARTEGEIPTATLILAGVAVNALGGALLGLLVYVADDAQLRALTFWSLGSLGMATTPVAFVVAALLALALAPTLGLARPLDALALGEGPARHLGVDVTRVRRRALLLAALLAGASTAACGVVGFVGLVVPHLARLAGGPGHRLALPAGALGGAALLVLADLAARTAAAPAELPLGTLTALLGAPFFLGLLRRARSLP